MGEMELKTFNVKNLYIFFSCSYSKLLAEKRLNQNLIFTLLSTTWDEMEYSCANLRQDDILKDYLNVCSRDNEDTS